MARVSSHLENMSDMVNGIRFIRDDRGVMSEEVSVEVAERFRGIPGYTIHHSADDRAASRVVRLEGPSGWITISGTFTDDDLASLHLHWERGGIAAPVPDDGDAPAVERKRRGRPPNVVGEAAVELT